MSQSKWNILLVEDSEDDYILTRAMLADVIAGKFDLIWAASYDTGLDFLGHMAPDILLVDYDLGPRTGFDFLRAARELGCRTPAILLTGHSSYEMDLEAMKMGVADYLEKGQVSGLMLERAIRYTIERQQIQSRLEQLNEDLEARVRERTRELEETNCALEQANTRLRDEQELLQQVLNILPVGVWITDAKGVIERGNPAGQSIWAGARYVGPEAYHEYKGWWLATGQPIAPQEWAAARAVSQGETSINEEVEIECFDGSRKIIQNSSIPLRGEAGEVNGAIIVNHDITAIKRAELNLAAINKTLAAANQLFERVFSTIHLAVAYLDRDFNFIRVNRRYAQADHQPETYYIGKNHFDLFPNAENEAIFRRVVETGEPFITYARLFVYTSHPERGVTYWDWSLQPVKEPDGTVSGLILSLLDVTEQQLARQALDYQAYLLDNVNDAVIASDASFRYTSWNRAAETIFGWKREEVMGRSPAEVLSTQYTGLTEEEALRQLRETGQFQGEVTHTRRDGECIPVEMKISALHDDSGRLTGYVSIHRDITKRRQAEEQARRVEAELNEIKNRLMDGAEAERLQLARELHDGPIQDLYGISLQLRTLTDVLPRGDDNEVVTGLQGSIQRVIDTLRATSLELRPPTLTRFGLAAAIRSQTDQYHKMQPSLKINLDLQMAGSENDATGEQAMSERLRVALFRIYQMAMVNIIRHANASEVTIQLRADAKNVMLEIRDNGAGFRVPARWVELARQGHLGLVGAVERAEALGGQMQVISQPGHGATIRVSLPRGS